MTEKPTAPPAPDAERGDQHRHDPQPVEPQGTPRMDEGMVHSIAPAELPRLAPKLKPYLRA